MSEGNLILFSPTSTKNPVCFSNPTDCLDAKENISQNNGADKIFPMNSFGLVDAEMLSSSLHDYGKESLGILPPNLGRDSLGFLNTIYSETSLRDSLGFRSVLHIPEYRGDTLDCGKESLGILQLTSVDVRFGDEDNKVPEIMLTPIKESNDDSCNIFETAFVYASPRKPARSSTSSYCSGNPDMLTPVNRSTDDLCNVFETAFLFPSPRKTATSSSSHYSGNPSFHSRSLEGPSKIYSLKSNTQYDRDFGSSLKSSFSGGTSVPSAINEGKIISDSETDNLRTRIQSLPNTMNTDSTAVCLSSSKFWSTGKPVKTKSLSKRSFHGTLDFDEQKENIFIDSVFIEGSHLAKKIADGSILHDSAEYENGILDSTPQPSWPDDLTDSPDNENSPKTETDTVFKTIDKILPHPRQLSLDGQRKTSTSESTPGESKKAKELLENLSEILNSTHRSDSQISEGQNLLTSLAAMLHGKSNLKTVNFDDSGHSSFVDQADSSEKDKHECFEVLDFSKKSSGDISKETSPPIKALDLSLKIKPMIHASEKRLSQSFNSATPSITLEKSEVATIKNSSVSEIESAKKKNSSSSSRSNDSSQTSGNFLVPTFVAKLKPKAAISSSGMKKGPLKALLPVTKMKRKSLSNSITPEKLKQKVSFGIQSTRTSTPLYEPKLKPMAASTPTPQSAEPSDNAVSSLPKTRRSLPSMHLARDQLNGSSANKSIPKLIENRPNRTKSAIEFKENENRSVLKRSNSTGKESGSIMSSLSKVRENLVTSSYYTANRRSPLMENSIERGKRCSEVSERPVNLFSKIKRAGKENLSK